VFPVLSSASTLSSVSAVNYFFGLRTLFLPIPEIEPSPISSVAFPDSKW
jgi:hypothetical protein